MTVIAATGDAVAQRDEMRSLNGTWQFKLDPDGVGEKEAWFAADFDRSDWRAVVVPHTWQVEPANQDYYGAAWYAREIAPDPHWAGRSVRLEFGAAYRDCRAWLNGKPVGRHTGSGWTPFGFPVGVLEPVFRNVDVWRGQLDTTKTNLLVVRVDNRFSEEALPYEDSFDWAADGGLIRDVALRISPETHFSELRVEGVPNGDFSSANITVECAGERGFNRELALRLYGPNGRLVHSHSQPIETDPKGHFEDRLEFSISDPALWHFDHPNLYRLVARILMNDQILHEAEVTFGIRTVEVRDNRFWLNGEPMRLMGVEWMPGSDPRYGMAQDPRVVREIVNDLKRLNCVLTRFHWQQDDSVLDLFDRKGILLQEEVPAWGGKTMEADMGLLKKLLEQHLKEMIEAHRHHPSIYAWGLCNEIGGNRDEAREFVRHGREIARRLDPRRLLTYASNSLHSDPEGQAGGLLDFLEWNDYYGSWYRGGSADVLPALQRIHEAFPDKPVVISEYGLCECNPNHPQGDEARIEMLRSHTEAYRQADWVAGAIYFDYNDYRTHIGDKGHDEFRQRVHGVVDLLGRRKPSWQVLREEASPIRLLRVRDVEATGSEKAGARVEIVTRSLENDLPAYTLRGYALIWKAEDEHGRPMGTGRVTLPDLAPGSRHVEAIEWPPFEPLTKIHVEVFRPTGYSVLDAEWVRAPGGD